MKRIRRSRTARFVSWLLTVVLVLPMLQGLLAPRPAFAQGVALGNEQSAIIVDFQNKSGVQGDLLSRFVTTAVANELEGTGRYIFLPARDVLREAQDQGRQPPYDQIAISAIASKLGAAAIVGGEISKVWNDTKSTPRVVRVGVKIKLIEPASGDVLNGAAQIGEATARPGQDEDSLVQEAARNAVTLGVRQIMAFTLPEGIILTVIGPGPAATGGSQDIAIVNKGHTDGLRNGTQMIVFRGRLRTGKILITNAMARDSEARVLENTYGLRPEDRVRAIFPMPDFPDTAVTTTRRTRRGSSIAPVGVILSALVLGGILIAMAQGGSRTTVTSVTAEPEIINGAAATRVQWRDNLWAGQVREYQIWRSPDTGFFPTTGTPVGVSQSRDYHDISGQTFWATGRQFLRATLNAGNTIGNTDAATAELTDPSDPPPSGPTIGNTYTYLVNSILSRILPDVDGTVQDVYSDAVTSGPATPINAPGLLTPADQLETVNLKQFDPTWQSRRGATAYVVEVSPDPTFGNRSAVAQVGMLTTLSSGTDNAVVRLAAAVDLTKDPVLLRNAAFAQFVNSGAGQPTLYWRVGGRNNDDVPGPVHWFSKVRTDGDRTFRFIYSQPFSFKPAPLPPPPP